jgi:hypothetical protein
MNNPAACRRVTLTLSSSGGEEKGSVISETQIKITTVGGLLLFNNQRNIEKCRILTYITYKISAIEELAIRPKETQFPKLHIICSDLFFSCYAFTGYVNPCS